MANKAMKAMTAKEFWEVLEGAGYNKSVWGYEGILNIISIHESNAEKEDRQRGLNSIADASRERADYIYNYLTDRGYYND